MTPAEYDLLCSATRRMTVSAIHTREVEWIVEIETTADMGEGRTLPMCVEAYASTPEAAFRKAMKQLRWELRDAPAKAAMDAAYEASVDQQEIRDMANEEMGRA